MNHFWTKAVIFIEPSFEMRNYSDDTKFMPILSAHSSHNLKAIGHFINATCYKTSLTIRWDYIFLNIETISSPLVRKWELDNNISGDGRILYAPIPQVQLFTEKRQLHAKMHGCSLRVSIIKRHRQMQVTKQAVGYKPNGVKPSLPLFVICKMNGVTALSICLRERV